MIETMRTVMRGEVHRAAPDRTTPFTLHPDGRTDIVSTDEKVSSPHRARDDGLAQSVRLHPWRIGDGTQRTAASSGVQGEVGAETTAGSWAPSSRTRTG